MDGGNLCWKKDCVRTQKNGDWELENTGDINRPTYDSYRNQTIYRNKIPNFALDLAAFFVSFTIYMA